ncbi:hypothetical protein [Microbulbifer guangxiensis]|uniref:hypothetical protein n=1 Tax=Microbulbifer guangxiensis TaxID=2904249 RepID=UPI001F24E6CF|nr:hypothetical protein [Microbulbifer guangxiensis]
MEYIEIEPERSSYASEVKLDVTLNIKDFRGSYGGVYVSQQELNRFIDSLYALEDRRQGAARFCSRGPDELLFEYRQPDYAAHAEGDPQLLFEIRSTDTIGHMAIEAQLHRYYFGESSSNPVYLKGCFDVGPEVISELILLFHEAEKLINS